MCSEINDFKCNKKYIYDSINKISEIEKKLNGFKDLFEKDLSELSTIVGVYKSKAKDLYAYDKKLKIAVIGQVNAGKSSFLNTLLFNGENILSKACIPKTINMTKIGYCDENKLEIEFYSEEEWNELKRNLVSEGGIEGINFLKTSLKLIKDSKQNYYNYINREKEVIQFENNEDLYYKMKQYDDKYCKYSFLIKSINLYINDDRLKNIELIDTPGINDPNSTRKYTIKKCLEYVDIMFFLSQSSVFLDDVDIDLITNEISSNEMSKIILLASKYDSALLDEGWNFENLLETEEYIKLKLINKAERYLCKYISNPTPIFVSAMANNLALKQVENYNDEESYMITELNDLWDEYEFDKEKLIDIGNFCDVKSKINQIIDAKEKTFNENSKILIPKFKSEVEQVLYNIREKSKIKISLIEQYDMNSIKEEQEKVKQKVQKTNENVEKMFEDIIRMFKDEKKKVEKQLYEDYERLTNLEIKQKTIKIEVDNYVSNNKWYDVFLKKANKKQDENYYTYECLEIIDAANNIFSFTSENVTYIQKTINNLLNKEVLKKNIIKLICENLNEYDIRDIKLLIENSISGIKASQINVNLEKYIETITGKFDEEVIGEDIETLKDNYKASMESIYNEINTIKDNEFELFIFQLQKAEISIMKIILENANDRLEILKNSFLNLNNELQDYKKVIDIVELCEID